MVDEDIWVSRRRFLAAVGLSATLAAVDPGSVVAASSKASGKAVKATLRLQPNTPGRWISQQLVGLSYETLQMHNPDFFSRDNAALVGLLRRLNPHGVLRLGGNSSDYAVWSEYREPLPKFRQLPHAGFRRPYVITPRQLANLSGFLEATGWRLVFGVNVFRGSPRMAAELAEAVRREVGERLMAVQIGNEPNLYRHADGRRFDFDEYLAMWRRGARAIRQRVSVPLAGPDTAASNDNDWVRRFAEQAKGIVALSRHYYRGGAPEPTTSIAQLLSGDPAFFKALADDEKVAKAKQLPLLISEVNSYWGGGKLGVSNTFASALWGGDFALACAQTGVDGLNIHSGTLAVLEASLDKSVAAVPEGADYKQRLDAISGRYTPIAGDVGVGYYARPLYYGLLLAQHLAGARFIGATLDAGGANLTAYAARREKQGLLAVFNKDMRLATNLDVQSNTGSSRVRVWRLRSSSLEDVHDVRLAGSEVGRDGAWSPAHEEILPAHAGCFTLPMPAGSAALVFMD